jgi:pantoate--beta-alanine ligase
LKIFQHISSLLEWRDSIDESARTVGFVPTMGALHTGHQSLIIQAKKDCDIVVCSIFVNPAQFNEVDDLIKYPRKPELDSKMLQECGCDVLFMPDSSEIYPNKSEKPTLEFGNLSSILEAAFRPGHFEGVAQIIDILFSQTRPTKAYFGEKDFQQLAIVKAYSAVHHPKVQIIPCPIIRSADGLALSSRNELLSLKEKNEALVLSKILYMMGELSLKMSPKEVKEWVYDYFENQSTLDLEYFELVHADSFDPLLLWDDAGVALIAAFCGEVRLIDNQRLSPLLKLDLDSEHLQRQIG